MSICRQYLVAIPVIFALMSMKKTLSTIIITSLYVLELRCIVYCSSKSVMHSCMHVHSTISLGGGSQSTHACHKIFIIAVHIA